jgi:hypothetical protein
MGLAADTDLVTFGNGTIAITGAVTGVTTITATQFVGGGVGVTGLAAANITASGTLPALNGAALTALTAANITASGTLPALNGAALTALNGTQVTSGTLPAARIAADSIVEAKLDVSNGPTNGQFLQAQSGEGGGLTWAAAGGGAVTREGGNTTAGTTTSTTLTDVLSVTSLTIGQLQPFYGSGIMSKTTGASSAANGGGIKLNSTGVWNGTTWSSTNDRVEDGDFHWRSAARPTGFATVPGETLQGTAYVAHLQHNWGTPNPGADVTDVIYRGSVNSGSLTLSVDEVHIYSYATS